MGCDIHVHGEVKINGVWHHWSHPRISRSYSLFGKMAGVRDCSQEPIAQPRGIPDDATDTTKFDYAHWGVDAHTPSCLSGAEVDTLVKWYNKNIADSFEHSELGYIFGNGWDVKNNPGDYPAGVEDARLIFWFDN